MNEQTVAFVPKVVVILGALLILGPFMLITLTDFSHSLFDQLVAVGTR
jgi:flagellar biosynthetic protein FliQ